MNTLYSKILLSFRDLVAPGDNLGCERDQLSQSLAARTGRRRRGSQDCLSEQAVQEAFKNVCWHARQNPERRFSRLDVVLSQKESGSISPFLL